jgi:multimeric flavodoxin WrbA
LETALGCIDCDQCFQRKDKRCAISNDIVNGCIEKMIAADGIILASPTYFTDVTAEMKALIDRAGHVARGNNNMFRRKVGAPVVTARRGGQIHTYDTLNHFFLIEQMIVPGSSYWNLGIGRDVGEVESDAEGMETMAVLGQNIVWLLKKIHG